jgi:hypothetical protein
MRCCRIARAIFATATLPFKSGWHPFIRKLTVGNFKFNPVTTAAWSNPSIFSSLFHLLQYPSSPCHQAQHFLHRVPDLEPWGVSDLQQWGPIHFSAMIRTLTAILQPDLALAFFLSCEHLSRDDHVAELLRWHQKWMRGNIHCWKRRHVWCYWVEDGSQRRSAAGTVSMDGYKLLSVLRGFEFTHSVDRLVHIDL